MTTEEKIINNKLCLKNRVEEHVEKALAEWFDHQRFVGGTKNSKTTSHITSNC